MESKILTRTHDLPRLELPSPGEIEVPTSGAHYHISQTAGDQAYIFHLRTPETTLQLTGLLRPEEETALNVTIVHHAPRTFAETLVRTLGEGTSKSTFRGLIKIMPGAAGSESYLNHHSLLFNQARSWSWPALEIEHNEVKCSHAATIRTITDADLFYARSRGLSPDAARQLLIDAFLSDVQI